MINFYEFSKIIKESINSKDPVRNAVAGIESYWRKPGEALTAIQDILYNYGYIIPIPSFDVHDKSQNHTQRFPIEKRSKVDGYGDEFIRSVHAAFERGDIDDRELDRQLAMTHDTEDTGSQLIFSWHWMPSGEQVEVTAYIS